MSFEKNIAFFLNCFSCFTKYICGLWLYFLIRIVHYLIISVAFIVCNRLRTLSSFNLMIKGTFIYIWHSNTDAILYIKSSMLALFWEISQIACISINIIHRWQALILKFKVGIDVIWLNHEPLIGSFIRVHYPIRLWYIEAIS